MASYTSYVELYKKDPVLDASDTFNIKTMLNDNWDKLDLKLFDLNKDKIDKITGKGLSTNDFTTTLKDKLDGIEDGANKYTHPLKHPPAIIEQDLNNRFISDLELAQIEDNKINLGTHLADYTQQLGTVELQTTDKTLKGAINEVFQTGNNVKSDTVDALLSVDDSLPVSSEDSWIDIIGSIGQISTGARRASGTQSRTDIEWRTPDNGSEITTAYGIKIPKTDIGFIPSVIYIIRPDTLGNYPTLWLYDNYIATTAHVFRNVVFGDTQGYSPYDYDDNFIHIPTSSGVELMWVAYERKE